MPEGIGSTPAPRTPDPMAAPPLRWGVMGPGWIAERFIEAAHRQTRQQVVAIASRDVDRARAFAARTGVPRAVGGYEALAEDPEVDVVYVATPHGAHHRCALLALEAGKHTLVEKPLALNAQQGREIAAAAARAGVFCMEGLWTFTLPKFDVIRQIVEAGVLGELRTVIADHGEWFASDHRILRPDLHGGPLLDLGTYPVALAVALLGPAEDVRAVGQPAASGVTGQASIVMSHPGANQSVIHNTVLSVTPGAAVIAGSEGTLTMSHQFYFPGDFVVSAKDGTPLLSYREPNVRHGALGFEAAEVARSVHAGLSESGCRPLADTLATLAALDAIRGEIGERFAEDGALGRAGSPSRPPA